MVASTSIRNSGGSYCDESEEKSWNIYHYYLLILFLKYREYFQVYLIFKY